MAKWEYVASNITGAAPELTDLVNDRAREEWEPHLLTTVGNDNLVVLFRRERRHD